MAIADRIQESIIKMSLHNYENAMVQLSIAIEGTAKKKYDKKISSSERFRSFVNENEEFVIFVALGCEGRFRYLNNNAGFSFSNRGSLAQVLYKYVRNPLIHEGDVGDEIVFREGPINGHEGNKFIVSSELLLGLLLSVVGDPSNLKEKLKINVQIEVGGTVMLLNDIWGRSEVIKRNVGFL